MEIRNWITNEVIYQAEVNTFMELVEKAVKECVDLSGANLFGAHLGGANLEGANLRDADLFKAYFVYANLKGADLSGANLRAADLRYADLFGAHLGGASLESADIWHADLSDSDLRDADLNFADLRHANLKGADLRDADFFGARIIMARNVPDNLPMACPKEGSFIAWKKVKDKLVKLEIPEDARRSSATTKKCRCNKAKVLEITDVDGANSIDEIVNQNYNKNTIYRVGEMVYPDSFDGDRWNECSNGIHFFMNKQDAINYL